MRTPFVPVVVPAPWMLRFRRRTLIPLPLMIAPLMPPELRMPPAYGPPSIVIDLVMVTTPNPPGSSTLISPPAAVLEIAPAKVLQGAVRLHGLASSPTPDTQVRVAWAKTTPGTSMSKTIAPSAHRATLRFKRRLDITAP